MTTIDTTPNATYTIDDTVVGDTINVTDGPIVAGPLQTTHVSDISATLDVEFANKTAVTIDGGGDGDSVVFDNPDPATGMTSLTVQNLGTGSTITGNNPTAGAPDVAVGTLQLDAAAGIGTLASPLETQVSTLGADSGTGGVFIENNAAASGPLDIAGVDGVEVTGSGDLTLINHGTIDSDTDGDTIRGPGNVTVEALGANADVDTGGQSSDTSIRGLASGTVTVEAGRDINLGDASGFGSVRSVSGSIMLSAGRNITLDANAVVNVIGGTGSITATAGGSITMLTSPGNELDGPEVFTAGGTISLSTGAGGTLTLASTGADAVASAGGNITLTADIMDVSAGVDAASGNVQLESATAGLAISLGTATGGLALTNATLDEVTATTLTVGSTTAGDVTVGGTVDPAGVTNLTIESGANVTLSVGAVIDAAHNMTIDTAGDFTADAGSSMTAAGGGTLTIDFGSNGTGDTADFRGATVTAGTIDATGGAGNDTIFAGPGGQETIDGGGGANTAVFSGDFSQYTIVANIDGSFTVTDNRPGSPDGTDKLINIQMAEFADVTVPLPPTPVVTATLSAVPASASETFSTSQLFSASSGLPILTYEVEDESVGPSQGFWVLNGAVLPYGQITTLMAAQLSELSFVAGSASTPVSDTLEVAASDAAGLGAFTTFTVTAAAHAPTTAPTVAAVNVLQAPSQALAGSSLFLGTAFDGNTIMSYEVEDITTDSGHWVFNGTVEPTNQVIDVTVAQLAQLSFDTGYGSDTLMVRANDGTQWGSDTSFTVTPPPNAAPPAGTSATLVMLRNSDGAYEFYDIGHNVVLLDGPLGQINPVLQVAGVGGFNGADTADLLMRDPTTGVFTLYDVSNNNITGNVVVGQVGLEWTVSGFGDFSTRANETDMLMRNSNTGQFEVYDIANNAVTFAGPMGQVGLEWTIAGFGDFSTRANETDMLMRNSNTGQFEVYDIANNAVTFAGPMGQVGLEWTIAGFGDFSGNANETDMLMRNSNTGVFEVYDIANNAVTFAGPMGQVGLEWTIAGFGDFSGNANETDMLMRNSNTGVFELFDISNNTVTGTAPMGQVGLEWSIGGVSATPASAPPTAQLTQAMASFAPSAGTLAASSLLDQTAVQTTTVTPLAASNEQMRLS